MGVKGEERERGGWVYVVLFSEFWEMLALAFACLVWLWYTFR